jgi:hypothetical protein
LQETYAIILPEKVTLRLSVPGTELVPKVRTNQQSSASSRRVGGDKLDSLSKLVNSYSRFIKGS